MHDPQAKSVSPQPLPELAADLRAHRAEIIDDWQRMLPGENGLSLAQLRGDLPSLLESLAVALEAGQPPATIVPSQTETSHRAQLDLDDRLAAYQLLRAAIFQQLQRARGRGLMPGEVLGLNFAIDLVVRSAAVAYAGHHARLLADQERRMREDLSRLSHDIRGDLNSAVLLSDVLRRKLGADARFADSAADLAALRKSMLDAAGRIQRLLDQQRGGSGS